MQQTWRPRVLPTVHHPRTQPKQHPNPTQPLPHPPRWLILGPKHSGSTCHVDPNGTCAWNAVIYGRKKWVLFPPNAPPPGVHPSRNGAQVVAPVSLLEWFQQFYEEARADGRMVEGVCGQGDVVFVPAGWWHLVMNLEETLAVTQNFVCEGNLPTVGWGGVGWRCGF